MGYGTTAHNKR